MKCIMLFHMMRNMHGLVNLNTGEGNILNEIFTEVAATRTSFSRDKEDDEHFRQETSGYDDITFIANLLAASFGIEERELLRGGIQNREELQKVLKQYVSDEHDLLFHNVDILRCNLDVLFNALNTEEKSNQEEVIASTLEQIYGMIYDISSMAILENTREINQEYVGILAYNYQKMESIIQDSLVPFASAGIISEEKITELISTIVSDKSLDYLMQVSDYIALLQNKEKITNPVVWQEMEQLARYGELIEHAEKFGIEIEKEIVSRDQLIKAHKKINHEFDDVVEWDNEDVIRIMKELWREKEVINVRKEIRSEKIKNFFMKFKNRKQRKLNAPDENHEGSFMEPESDFDERYKVSQEQIQPMEFSTKSKEIEKENGKE